MNTSDPSDSVLESAFGGLIEKLPAAMASSIREAMVKVAGEELEIGTKQFDLQGIVSRRYDAAVRGATEEVLAIDKQLFTEYGIKGGTYLAESPVVQNSASKARVTLGVAIGSSALGIETLRRQLTK